MNALKNDLVNGSIFTEKKEKSLRLNFNSNTRTMKYILVIIFNSKSFRDKVINLLLLLKCKVILMYAF